MVIHCETSLWKEYFVSFCQGSRGGCQKGRSSCAIIVHDRRCHFFLVRASFHGYQVPEPCHGGVYCASQSPRVGVQGQAHLWDQGRHQRLYVVSCSVFARFSHCGRRVANEN